MVAYWKPSNHDRTILNATPQTKVKRPAVNLIMLAKFKVILVEGADIYGDSSIPELLTPQCWLQLA